MRKSLLFGTAWDLWIGARASTLLWAVPVRAFAIYNTGQRKEIGGLPTFKHDDAGLKLEAGPVPVGSGKLSFQKFQLRLWRRSDDRLRRRGPLHRRLLQTGAHRACARHSLGSILSRATGVLEAVKKPALVVVSCRPGGRQSAVHLTPTGSAAPGERLVRSLCRCPAVICSVVRCELKLNWIQSDVPPRFPRKQRVPHEGGQSSCESLLW